MRTLGRVVASLAALTLAGAAAAQAASPSAPPAGSPGPTPAPAAGPGAASSAPPDAAAAPAAPDPSGAFRIRSAVLGEERSFVVLAPPGYATSGRRYPVVYFTDGSPSLALLATVTRFLAQNGRMPEVILVGIDHADRVRDLTPSPGKFEGAQPAAFKTAGGGDRFLSFLQDELIPHVERSYRTEPFRMLLGHSLGGLLAVHAQLARPGLFQATLALAPTLTWNGDEPVRRAREALAGARGPRGVMVIVSPNDGPAAAKQAQALARTVRGASGLQVAAVELPEEDHWSVVLEGATRGFKEVFAGWTMPAPAGAVGPGGGLPAVERHYARLSERLGWTVRPPEPVVDAAGRQAIRDGKLDDGIRALRQNAAWHPASAAAHDVLGMALVRADRLEEAKGAFRTALEVAERAKDPDAAAYRAHLEAATARAPIREPLNPTWPGLPNLCGKAGDRGWEDHHHHGN